MHEGYYHIYNRGINKAQIFFENKNYDYFLKKYFKYMSSHSDLYSYCLMPNHFHFLLRIVKDEEMNFANASNTKALTPVEKAFRDFFSSYAKAINKAYVRTGALFQARFKRKFISNEDYLARLVAYIHLNPVRAGLCKCPSEWKFSSYNILLSNNYTKLKRTEVIDWFGDKETFMEFHKVYSSYEKDEEFLFKI